MDSKRTFSGILQIVLGAGILAAGGILFYQKLTNGGPEKLSLKYTCESFRAIKEAQTVAQEQSLKLEKMLNLQLLQSRAAIENRRSFRESAAAVCELHTLYAAEQLAELSRAEAELQKLKALKKFCTDTVGEMKKVVWTPKNELKKSTILVVVSVLAIAIVIAVVDTAFSFVINGIAGLISLA